MNRMNATWGTPPRTRRPGAWIAVLVLLVSQFAGTGALLACPRSADTGRRECCCGPTSCCTAPTAPEGLRSACCTLGTPDPASPAAPPVPLPSVATDAPIWTPAPAFVVTTTTAGGPSADFRVDPTESPPRYQLIHAYLI